MSQYLTEAFRELEILNEDTFNLTDDGVKSLMDFEDKKKEDMIDIIDMNAETPEELCDSYVGKVIIDCCVCHSKLYKDAEDIIVNGEVANADEECPYCYSNEGFKVIGQVAAFEDEDEVDEQLKNEKDENKKEETQKEIDSLRDQAEEAEDHNSYQKATQLNMEADKLEEAVATRTREMSTLTGTLGNVLVNHQDELASCATTNQVVDFLNAISDEVKNKSFLEVVLKKVSKMPAMRGVNYLYNIILKGDNMGREKEECLDEGIFGIKTKKEKEKEAKAKAEREAKKQAEKERAEREEQARQEFAMDSWARNDRARRDAQKEYNRSRSTTQGSKLSNTGKAGVYYSGGDYYTESYKDTHMIMGGDGSEIYTDEDLEKIWDENHATDPSMKEYASFSEWKKDTVSNMEVIDECINEDLNSVNVETDDNVVNVCTSEDGSVTVTTKEKDELKSDAEVIKNLDADTKDEICSNVYDGEEIEVDVDEFDETSFDELGEGYLKKIYENVTSYKTTNIESDDNSLKVEGVINFNSGKSKKTQFIFESKNITKSGKVKFIGENSQITRGKKAFTLTGKIENKKFLPESFNYNYGQKNSNGKVVRLYGTIKK